MGCGILLLLSVFISVASVNGNVEGDLLHSWRAMLDDPNYVLQSWDATLVNPCTWFRVTCSTDARVVRLDLGNAGLSGPLSRGLAQLANLQYLEVLGNNLTGVIPSEFGNLTSLVSLDLFNNQLSGSIPPSLGNLKSLRYLRVNSNALSGDLPTEILELVAWGNLQVLNVSENLMTGCVPSTTSKGLAITTIIQDSAAA